jgi:DNA-binding transcriptional LysR family regulator
MDINQIRYFLALAETLNFTRAAERCFVSQPALTQAIKRLEEEMGGELIHRDGRDTRLTELGRLLRTHFEQIEHTRQVVKDTAQAYVSGQSQELHIGLMCTIGPRFLGRFLNDFQLKYPHILLLLHDVPSSDMPELLRSGALDAAFSASHGEPRDDALRAVVLFEETMVVAFPQQHAFQKLETVPLSDVVHENYVDRLHCEFRDDFFAFCKDQSVKVNVVFRSQREDWIQGFIREGVGVSVMPEYSLLQPPLSYRPVSDPPLSRQVELLVADRDQHSEALNAFVEMVEQYPWKSMLESA